MHFSWKIFGQFKKKQYLCTRSPGNSSPKLCVGDESGFLFCYGRF